MMTSSPRKNPLATLPLALGATALVASSFVACITTTTNATPDEPTSDATAASTAALPPTATGSEPASSAPAASIKIPTFDNGPPGEWSKPNPNGKANGEACGKPDDCKSGVCEGEGCGGAGPKCVDANRACTRDLVAYCGCDGKTFSGSGTCAGRPFRKKGTCE
jgi:hypothetical protein